MSSCNGGLRTSPFKSSQYNQDLPYGGATVVIIAREIMK